MGRKKHNPKMRRMGMWFAKHGQHKHKGEIDRLLEAWRQRSWVQRARLRRMYGSVAELMADSGRKR